MTSAPEQKDGCHRNSCVLLNFWKRAYIEGTKIALQSDVNILASTPASKARDAKDIHALYAFA